MSKFGKEFAKQRAAGAKEFKFGGKSYNTKLKTDTSKAKTSSKSVPIPKSRDSAISGMAKSKPSFSGLSNVASQSKTPPSPSTRGYGGPARIASSKAMIAAGKKKKDTSGGFKAAMKKVGNSIKMGY